MSYRTQFEREEDAIIESMNNGELSQEDGRRELRELRRDYDACARRAAQDAYDAEYERW